MRLVFILLMLPLVSSMTLTEIESNPAGTDTGNEWIEFYSELEIDLKDYSIKNNDGDEIQLSGKFTDYFVYSLEKQWLDNSDEKIFLYQNDNLIQETILFEDSENNEKTWSFCDKWEFKSSTKNSENNCEKEQEEIKKTEEPEENKRKSESELIPIENVSLSKKEIIKEPQPIKLTGNSIKETSETNYAVYGLIIFCIFLGILFILQKNKLYKTEFQ